MERLARSSSENGPRSSVSLSDLKTPIVDNFLSLLPTGHEKALKYAFFNVLALILAAFAIFALYGVYLILEPFWKSLLWALLCGSVLHPLKEKICTFARTWLKGVKASSTPFTVKVFFSPLKIVDGFSDKVGSYITSFWKSILSTLALFIVTYILYYNPPIEVALFFQNVFAYILNTMIWIFSCVNFQVVMALNLIYFITIAQCIATKWFDLKNNRNNITQTDSASPTEQKDENTQPRIEDKNKNFHSRSIQLLSYLTWTFTIAYVFFHLPYPLMISALIFVIIGIVTYFRKKSNSFNRYSLPHISRYAYMMVLNMGASPSNVLRPLSSVDTKKKDEKAFSVEKEKPLCSDSDEKNEKDKKMDDNSYNPLLFPSSPLFYGCSSNDAWNTANTVDEIDGKIYNSNNFLYGVLLACIAVHIWNHLWLIHLLPIPVLYYGLKKFLSRFQLMEYFKTNIKQPLYDFYRDQNGLSQYLFPQPVRLVFKILYIADKKLVKICENYVDPVSSLLIVIIVVLGTLMGCLFAATQIYAEGDHLVRVSVNLINSTVSNYPDLLPDGWHSVMDSLVENAYLYGKENIKGMIRENIAEKNPEKAELIEKQLIELWDRFYLTWNQTEHIKSNIKMKSFDETTSWNHLLETGKEMPGLLDVTVLTNYAKSNVGTLLSISESLWNVLIGNISLAISAITALISLLLGGGTAILNLLINLIVFFTALFYLLSSSTSVYKPVELFNFWSPGKKGVYSNNFAIAVEDAINGVFIASFKMAAFYGMWTWLIHTLFQVKIVFIPSICAAFFSAIPFLMPYWAAVIPAILEILLIQGQWTKAILMLLAQMAPMSVVDTQIYSEIKGGGHPYLTGLSVAGGIFCFGPSGAVLGPVILCCVVVAVKIVGSFMTEESNPDNVNPESLFMRQCQIRRNDSDLIGGGSNSTPLH